MRITRREFLVRAAHASGASFATMQSLGAGTPELWKLGIVEASALIRRKAVSPVELTQAYLARIEKLNPLVNACDLFRSLQSFPKSCEPVVEVAMLRPLGLQQTNLSGDASSKSETSGALNCACT